MLAAQADEAQVKVVPKQSKVALLYNTHDSIRSLVDTSPPLKNREALRQIEKELDLLTTGYGISGVATTGGVIFTNPLIAAGGITASGIILKRVEKVSRIARVGKAILDSFESEDIQLYPRLEVTGCNPLDLFIRFPSALILISIRSMRGATIVYKEDAETLLVKRAGKGAKKWLPDPLVELSEYQRWIKTNRQKFDLTSSDVRGAVAKVLVMTGSTKIDTHREHLYSSIDGDKRVLTLKRKGTAFVIQEEEVSPFISSYLAKYS